MARPPEIAAIRRPQRCFSGRSTAYIRSVIQSGSQLISGARTGSRRSAIPGLLLLQVGVLLVSVGLGSPLAVPTGRWVISRWCFRRQAFVISPAILTPPRVSPLARAANSQVAVLRNHSFSNRAPPPRRPVGKEHPAPLPAAVASRPGPEIAPGGQSSIHRQSFRAKLGTSPPARDDRSGRPAGTIQSPGLQRGQTRPGRPGQVSRASSLS
jgi:hypothetical protein